VRNVFAVLDPTRLVQPALEKAEWIAARNNATLQLYCCVYDSDSAADSQTQKDLVTRTEHWIERLVDRPRGEGLEVAIRVESRPDWRNAVAAAASESGSDLVVKTASPHGALTRRLMETSDWSLLRSCARPVLLVSSLRSTVPTIVLAAVKLKPTDDVHLALNERVVDSSHQIAASLGAELHAVTVYKGEDIYFDRQRFADACRLPRNRVHATEGSSFQGIAEVAEQIGAGVVIIGSAQNPSNGSAVGATAERVIDQVSADVVVLPVA
jgi:universal stress protein E